ncbi:MAG: Asp-tRNA(Asn)/Glu-tRNA(Gln) amidotransferase subunit GatC [Legionella sp.]|nr:MAG: Asp-tRNA(Asn)/Glu-tRNA(Gln) amidotransferase subunit GatC [Legionella sp.]
MTISQTDLEKIARLAYLDTDLENTAKLSEEISSIMDFVEQLRQVDTSQIAPLFHPYDLHQRLRPDIVTEEECLEELATIAPMFEDNLYLVPKVLEADK